MEILISSRMGGGTTGLVCPVPIKYSIWTTSALVTYSHGSAVISQRPRFAAANIASSTSLSILYSSGLYAGIPAQANSVLYAQPRVTRLSICRFGCMTTPSRLRIISEIASSIGHSLSVKKARQNIMDISPLVMSRSGEKVSALVPMVILLS